MGTEHIEVADSKSLQPIACGEYLAIQFARQRVNSYGLSGLEGMVSIFGSASDSP